jgi:NADPH:quinone reductase-like Zn-dependent oxidoreductase
VGRLITVLALERGLTPLRLVRNRQGADALRGKLPGAPVFTTADANWPEQVRGAVDGRPIYLALDAVGGSLIGDLAAVLADGGTVVSYGALGTGSPGVRSFIPRGLGLQGVSIGRWAQSPAELRAEDVATAIRLARSVPEQFDVAAEYAPTDIARAVEHVGQPGKIGTVMLRFSS